MHCLVGHLYANIEGIDAVVWKCSLASGLCFMSIILCCHVHWCVLWNQQKILWQL